MLFKNSAQLFPATEDTSCLALTLLASTLLLSSRVQIGHGRLGGTRRLAGSPSLARLLPPALAVSPTHRLLHPGDLRVAMPRSFRSFGAHPVQPQAAGSTFRPPTIAPNPLPYPCQAATLSAGFCFCNSLPSEPELELWVPAPSPDPTRAPSGQSRPCLRCPKDPHRPLPVFPEAPSLLQSLPPLCPPNHPILTATCILVTLSLQD